MLNLDRLLLTQYEQFLYFYKLEKVVRPALIVVDDLKSTWGQWCSHSRVIRVARRLLTGYEWDVIINVLKHEMAHQLVDEMLTRTYGPDDRPHGRLFVRACDILGVAVWARGASIDMDKDSKLADWKERKNFEVDHPVFKRIHKLLSLAESSNQFEAELAAQRASELHRKYLSESGQRPDADSCHLVTDAEHAANEFDTIYISEHSLKIDAVQSAIFGLLHSHYGVRCIFTEMVSVQRGIRVKAVAVMGRRKSLVMAEYAYDFLRRSVEGLWRVKKKEGMPTAYKRSYQLGAVRGFRECLDKVDEFGKVKTGLAPLGALFSPRDNKGLMRKDQLAAEAKALNSYVSTQFPRVSNSSSRGAGVYGDAYRAGQADGSNLKMRTPLRQGGSSGGFGGLLG